MSGLKRKRPDDEFANSNSALVKNHVSDKDMDKKSEVRMESVYQKTLLKLRNGARNASNNNMGASGDSQAQPDQGASKLTTQCCSCLNKCIVSTAGRCGSCSRWSCSACLKFCLSCSLYENPAAKICGNCSVPTASPTDHNAVLCLNCRHQHMMS